MSVRAHLSLRNLLRKNCINTSLVRLDGFVKRLADSLSDGARVLDAGAGSCPYQKHFQHVQYEAADFCELDRSYAAMSYVCDLSSIPVEDERYDLVLCTQVLEHVPDPPKVLREFNRILKPGGTLWLSAPMYYEEHDQPYDFFRYTQYSFRYLVENAGFEIKELNWVEGYYMTLAHQFEMAGVRLSAKPSAYGGGLVGLLVGIAVIPLRPFLLTLSALFSRLDLRHKYTDGGHCINYCVIARKSSVRQAG